MTGSTSSGGTRAPYFFPESTGRREDQSGPRPRTCRSVSARRVQALEGNKDRSATAPAIAPAGAGMPVERSCRPNRWVRFRILDLHVEARKTQSGADREYHRGDPVQCAERLEAPEITDETPVRRRSSRSPQGVELRAEARRALDHPRHASRPRRRAPPRHTMCGKRQFVTLPPIASRMPVSPAHSASSVLTFGTRTRTGIWRSPPHPAFDDVRNRTQRIVHGRHIAVYALPRIRPDAAVNAQSVRFLGQVWRSATDRSQERAPRCERRNRSTRWPCAANSRSAETGERSEKKGQSVGRGAVVPAIFPPAHAKQAE